MAKLSLPLVGEVDASGKTVGQLQSELIELYRSQLKIAGSDREFGNQLNHRYRLRSGEQARQGCL